MEFVINILYFEINLILKRSIFLKAYLFTLVTVLFVSKFYYNIYIISYLFLVSFFFLLKIYNEDKDIGLFYAVNNISLCSVHKAKVIILFLLFLLSIAIRLFVIPGNIAAQFISLISAAIAAFFVGLFCGIKKDYLKILLFVISFILISVINYLAGIYLSIIFLLIVIYIFIKGFLNYE